MREKPWSEPLRAERESDSDPPDEPHTGGRDTGHRRQIGIGAAGLVAAALIVAVLAALL